MKKPITVLLFTLATTHHSFANDLMTDLNPITPEEADYRNAAEDLLHTISNWSLEKIGSQVRREIELALSRDPEQYLSILLKVSEELSKILNDDNKNETEKASDILVLIDASMGEYSSEKESITGLNLQHSQQYGVTKLNWDHNITVDSCYFIDFDTETGWTTGWFDARFTPDYYIYKIINGNEKLLTKIKGGGRRSSMGFTIGTNGDFLSVVKSYYDYSTTRYSPPSNTIQVSWYDFDSQYRQLGDSVFYKIKIDNKKHLGHSCGNRVNKTGVVALDSDGNGIADFLPGNIITTPHVNTDSNGSNYYSAFQKSNAWIVPLISNIE